MLLKPSSVAEPDLDVTLFVLESSHSKQAGSKTRNNSSAVDYESAIIGHLTSIEVGDSGATFTLVRVREVDATCSVGGRGSRSKNSDAIENTQYSKHYCPQYRARQLYRFE